MRMEIDALLVVSKLGYSHAKQILTYIRIANKDGVKYRYILNSQI